MRFITMFQCFLVVVAAAFSSSAVSAVPQLFTLDDNESFLFASATAQAPNSDVTALSGVLPGDRAGSLLTFVSAGPVQQVSSILTTDTTVSSDATVTIDTTLSGLVFNIAGGPVGNGSPAPLLDAEPISGTLTADWLIESIFGDVSGTAFADVSTLAIPNNAGGLIDLQVIGLDEELTIPLALQFDYSSLSITGPFDEFSDLLIPLIDQAFMQTLNLQGEVVALAPVPEPTTLIIAGLLLCPLILRRSTAWPNRRSYPNPRPACM